MTDKVFVGRDYESSSLVPKDHDLQYLCEKCGSYLDSIPTDNVSCACRQVYIDRDWHRLVVTNPRQFSVWRKVKNPD